MNYSCEMIISRTPVYKIGRHEPVRVKELECGRRARFEYIKIDEDSVLNTYRCARHRKGPDSQWQETVIPWSRPAVTVASGAKELGIEVKK